MKLDYHHMGFIQSQQSGQHGVIFCCNKYIKVAYKLSFGMYAVSDCRL